MNATPFDTLPQRFAQEEANAFWNIFHALDRSYVDTVVLCLLLEERAKGIDNQDHESDWIACSYRGLAARSRGAFAYRVVAKSLDRLAQVGCIEVSGQEGLARKIRINLGYVRDLIHSTDISTELNGCWLLWLQSILGSWLDSAVVSVLVKNGAHVDVLRITLVKIRRQMGDGSLRGILKSLDRLVDYGLLKRGQTGKDQLDTGVGIMSIQRSLNRLVDYGMLKQGQPGKGDLFGLQLTPELNSLLAQEADAWLADGSPEEPWAPGLRFAVSLGSVPGEMAFVESAVRTPC